MKYKNWNPEIWQKIETAIHDENAEFQKQGSNLRRPVAAFDADGTLWDTDLGEAFFKYQIQHRLVGNLPRDPWEHYQKMKSSGDPRPAYLWLAQINQGVEIEKLRNWAESCVRSLSPLPIFEDQARLIALLQKFDFEVFVVTASVKWAVEPGAKRLGVPSDHVLGVATAVENGIVTNQAHGIMTYREGKPAALLEANNQRQPFLVSGNTLGDLQLLASAQRVSLVVGAAKPGEALHSAEEQLRMEAKTRNWIIHQF